jgi:hypothetical protein
MEMYRFAQREWFRCYVDPVAFSPHFLWSHSDVVLFSERRPSNADAMNKETDTADPIITQIKPSEIVGRDTIARYQAQFRAAAYACLSILSGETTDRVYCDFHDDFVCREQKGGKPIYHFYQVKTKSQRNFQWGRLAVLGVGMKKAKSEQIASSFAGKLMLHTVRFKGSCGSVVFLTNVQFDDDLEEVSTALATGDLSNATIKTLIDRFNEALVEGDPLDEATVKENIQKLILTPGAKYLDPRDHDFEAISRDAIFKYSEVDLTHIESAEIINNLVALVEKKSFREDIANLSESDLDDAVGVGVTDLLEILSLSKGAYQALLEGGDPKAIKTASILQRKLRQAGASDQIIQYSSKCKVAWDIWLRDKRHILPEFELNFLLEDLNKIKNLLARGHITFADVQGQIDALWAKLSDKIAGQILSRDLLIGGVFSALVRSEAQ